MSARFEIVTTARDQHHARFVAPNGKIVWTTETYKRRQGAENAVCSLTGHFIGTEGGPHVWNGSGRVEVRYVTAVVEVARPELPEVGAS